MNNLFRSVGIWLVVALVLMTVFNQFSGRQQMGTQVQMDYSQFMEEAKNGSIAKVTIEGRTLRAVASDGKRIISYAPQDLWMVSDLIRDGVKIEVKPEEEPSLLMNLFVSWFPMLLLIYPVWETLFSIYRKTARGVSPGVADALHFHQLIYRRLVRGVFHDDASRRMLM
ncbi:MAG: ATP-dependent metallopeptidase FtsH/Yme1/Tma family protein, partial [Candidatus Nitrotoga sp.]